MTVIVNILNVALKNFHFPNCFCNQPNWFQTAILSKYKFDQCTKMFYSIFIIPSGGFLSHPFSL